MMAFRRRTTGQPLVVAWRCLRGAAIGILVSVGMLTGAPAHDIYTGLKSPTGADCCGGSDCKPAKVVLDDDGELQILDGDKRWPAMDPRWYVGPSPDGSWHLCRPRAWDHPACTIGGEGT